MRRRLEDWRDAAIWFVVAWGLTLFGRSWRLLTCLVDSWGDVRHGRTPAIWRGR